MAQARVLAVVNATKSPLEQLGRPLFHVPIPMCRGKVPMRCIGQDLNGSSISPWDGNCMSSPALAIVIY